MLIKQRIAMGYMLSLALMLAITFVSVSSIYNQEEPLLVVRRNTVSLAEDGIHLLLLAKNMRTDVIQVQQFLTDISATRGLDGLNDGFDKAKNSADSFVKSLSEAQKIVSATNNTHLIALLDQMGQAFPPYYETGRKMAQIYMDNGPDAGNKMMEEFDAVAEKISAVSEQVVELVETETDRFANGVMQHVSSIEKNNKETSNIIIIVAGLSFASSLIISVYLYILLSRNFSDLDKDLDAIDSGRVDLPLNISTDGDTEFSKIARTVAAVKKSLIKMKELEAEQKMAEKRAEQQKMAAARELADMFESKIQTIIQSVAAAATELYQTSESMSAVIDNTSLKAECVSRTSSETAQNVQAVAAAAEEMSASVKEIAHQINRSVKAVNSAVDEMQKADQTSQLLDSAAQRIGEIVTLIQNIAGQINLLALNATIESARAGDAGKGFAVVAGEVKQLATQATRATDDITANIYNIKTVSEQVINALENIKSAIASVNEISSSISSAIEEQTAVTNEIASNMFQASNGTDRITNDIHDVSESSTQASSVATQTLSAARTLSEQAEFLSMEVTKFLDGVRNG